MRIFFGFINLISLLAYSIQGNSQNNSFTLTYHLPGCTSYNDAVELPDHGFLMCGYTNPNSAFGGTLYLAKINQKGDTVWTKKPSYLPSGSSASAIIPTGDGNYFVTGSIMYSNFTSTGLLLKITANGDTLWTKKYTNSLWSCFFDRIIAIPGNRFAILGYQIKSGTPYNINTWCLFTINANGDTLSSRQLQTQSVDTHNCMENVNNQLTMGDKDSSRAFLVVTQNTTQPVWEKHYPFSKIQGIKQIRQPNFYASVQCISYILSPFVVYNRMGMIKLNANGDTLFSMRYGNYDNRNTNDDVQDLCIAQDGNLLIAGTYNWDASQNADFSIVKSDTNGTMLWRKQYGDSTYQYLTRAITCNDGGTIMLGLTAPNLNSVFGSNVYDIYVVKADKNGNVTGIKEQTILNTESCKLYPNPFNVVATITFNLPKSITFALLKIYDIRGSLVHSYPLNSQESTLNISANDFENGVYLYGIEGENYTTTKKKMVVVK